MLKKTSLSARALASVLEQSTDCVKLVDVDGNLIWMNGNGLCAMEIDDFATFEGTSWALMWPAAVGEQINSAYRRAAAGETARFTAESATAKGTPKWWEISVSAVRDDDGNPAGFVAISRDVTQAERDREALQVLVAEMGHRLRNTYSILCSLLRGFARGDPAREVFADEMSERIMALAGAQSLFDHGAQATDLATLIDVLMAPFGGSPCTIDIAGVPPVPIGKAAADAIGLVLGELSVNSGKHGALTHGGSVGIDAQADDHQLRIEWREHCHHPVTARSRAGGQGLALIDRIVEARGGRFTAAWHDHGLTATLTIATAA